MIDKAQIKFPVSSRSSAGCRRPEMRSHGIPAATLIAGVLLGPSLADEARAEGTAAPRV